MFNDKILKSVAEAVKQVLTTEKLHPNQQKLDVHEPEKDKLTSKDFEMLRKGKKADVKEANNPFDLKNYKSQLPTKPGEKAGFDSKKISTGTVYTRKPVKDEKPLKEEDAYDKDRYAVKDGKAVKDNPGHMGSANYKDQAHHVWATSAEEALKKKSVKEGASQEDYLKEIEMAKKRAQGEGNPDLTKGKVTAVKQESVEQIDELKKSTLASYVKKASHDVAAKGATTRQFANDSEAARKGENYPEARKKMQMADKTFAKSWKRREGMAKAVDKLAKEEVEHIDEATMTHITLGNKVKNSDGGHNQDVHYKGKKIGSIESYKHRTGLRYGAKHDASDEWEAGSRSSEEAVDFVRTAHADHLKSMKKESVEHIDETHQVVAKTKQGETFKSAIYPTKEKALAQHYKMSKSGNFKNVETVKVKEEVEHIEERSMTEPEMKKREKIVKSMKKGMQGFKDRYGDRAKDVMYATATKQAMKD